MKRILSFLTLLTCLLAFCAPVTAEDPTPYAGTWIETEGYGTLTIRPDGTATMVYYDGSEMDTTWRMTEDGYRFGDGMWYNSPMELLDENTLSISDGWMIFAREGFLPTTDEALLLGAEPVGEEGEPFLGTWALTTLVMEGESIDPALFGLTMTLTFNADGTVVSDDDWEPYTTTWSVAYGNVLLEGDVLTLDENDQLVFAQDDGTMVFTRVAEETPDDIPAITLDAEPPIPTSEESAPFLGDWYLAALSYEGETVSPALLGIQMSITFFEEGLALLEESGEVETVTWYVQDGSAIIMDSIVTPTDDGLLVIAIDGGDLIFARLGEENPFGFEEPTEEEQWLALLEMMAATATEEEDLSHLPEAHRPFVGEWHLCYIATGGLTGDLRTMGVTGTLNLGADYWGSLTGVGDEYSTWYEEDGVIRFGEVGMPMYLIGEESDGLFLQYGTEMGGYMIFHQDEKAVWTPGMYPLAGAAPSGSEAPAAASAPAASAGALLTDAKYVCTSYSAAGFTMDAASLGAEYAVIFHANGTADFTLSGFTVTGLPFSADGVYTLDYYGNPLVCTPTDTGFDMDYYGAMMLHFVPAE